MRNDPVAVRSAKETILDMIGRDLDDQLRLEAMNGYSVASRTAVPERLKRFYDQTDRGRCGTHQTGLSEE